MEFYVPYMQEYRGFMALRIEIISVCHLSFSIFSICHLKELFLLCFQ